MPSAKKMDKGYLTLFLTPVVLMLLVAGGHFLLPRPTVAAAMKKHVTEENKLRKETSDLRDEITRLHSSIRSRLWTVAPDEIGASVMQVVDTAAHETFLKMQAFRPQKAVTVSGIVRYPYIVVLEGGYPAVLAFVKKIEDAGTKLAVTSVQLTGADGATDTVTASIGVVAMTEDGEGTKNGRK